MSDPRTSRPLLLGFLHGTVTVDPSGQGVSREQRVRQSAQGESTIDHFHEYVPIGEALSKLEHWSSQGAGLTYLSSLRERLDALLALVGPRA
jgi:hypothetical protein